MVSACCLTPPHTVLWSQLTSIGPPLVRVDTRVSVVSMTRKWTGVVTVVKGMIENLLIVKKRNWPYVRREM